MADTQPPLDRFLNSTTLQRTDALGIHFEGPVLTGRLSLERALAPNIHAPEYPAFVRANPVNPPGGPPKRRSK